MISAPLISIAVFFEKYEALELCVSGMSLRLTYNLQLLYPSCCCRVVVAQKVEIHLVCVGKVILKILCGLKNALMVSGK